MVWEAQTQARLSFNLANAAQGVLVYLSGEPGAPQAVLTQQELRAAGLQLHPSLDLDKLLARAGLQDGTKGDLQALEARLGMPEDARGAFWKRRRQQAVCTQPSCALGGCATSSCG